MSTKSVLSLVICCQPNKAYHKLSNTQVGESKIRKTFMIIINIMLGKVTANLGISEIGLHQKALIKMVFEEIADILPEFTNFALNLP